MVEEALPMNKNELIKAVAAKANLKVVDAEKAINGTIAAIAAELKKKGSVTLVGFGTFKVAERRARAGVNPKTGQKIQIKAARVPKFVAGKALKDKIRK
jgi:DNA-binding protein HU-beta